MILDPINDVVCLGQLTLFARELAPSTLVRDVARQLETRDRVIQWLQSLPQADDTGDERVRVIDCEDVPQRVRLFPDDPNCVERSLAAMLLLEVIAPSTPRALATVDKPLRHTGLVEQYGRRWHAVDLFPRRNFSWTDLRVDAHNAGSGLLKAWLGKDLGGGIANEVGAGEDYLFGKVKQPQKNLSPSAAGAQRTQQQQAQSANGFDVARLVGAGAKQGQPTNPVGVGGENASQEKLTRGARGTAFDAGRSEREARTERGDRDSYDARDEAQRFWNALRW